jgi:hypothetical protein
MADFGGLGRLTRGLSETTSGRDTAVQQRRAALLEFRWARRWSRPICGHGRHAPLARRALLQCNRCKHQVALTAGTIFHATKLPRVTWSHAIYHLSHSGRDQLDRAPPPARVASAECFADEAEA